MLVEVNTTTTTRSVRSIVREGEDDPNGDGYMLRLLPARTTRIAGDARLSTGAGCLHRIGRPSH